MKQPDNADIQESYRRTIRGMLPLCAWILAVLFLIYTTSHWLVLSPDVAKVMVPLAGISTIFYFLKAFWHEWARHHRTSIFNRIDPHFILSVYCLVCIVNAVVHLALSHEPFQTTDLMIIQVGIASVVLSSISFIFLNAVILCCWGFVVQNSVLDRMWIHFGFALLATTALSAIIFLFRRDSIRQLESKIMKELRRQKELIYTSKMVALGEMATGIAHEINNPLMIILGRANQLKEHITTHRLMDPEKIVTDLEKIETTVMRISKIIKGLRSFSRNTEADPKQAACLATIIDETISFCADRLRGQGVRISVNQFPKVEVFCRPAEISQVLLNLIQNSLDVVEKMDSQSSDRWIRMEVSDLGQEVRVRVIDGGSGIPAAIQEKIMQPFFTTKQVGQGTGLGLSISRGIVEEHGGKLSYLPEEPHTTFEILLPKTRF